MNNLLLNCDIGESFGAWRMGLDAEVMPLIDCANIACGFHAGDPGTMRRTVALAVEHGVRIGAHPGYPDLVGFGRRSLACSAQEVEDLLLYQIGALDGLCRAQGTRVRYVKPHGALYQDMMRDPAILAAVLRALAAYDRTLPLMLMSTRDNTAARALGEAHGIELWFEAFADRAYDGAGYLVSRSQPGAVHHDAETVLAQALLLARGARCEPATAAPWRWRRRPSAYTATTPPRWLRCGASATPWRRHEPTATAHRGGRHRQLRPAPVRAHRRSQHALAAGGGGKPAGGVRRRPARPGAVLHHPAPAIRPAPARPWRGPRADRRGAVRLAPETPGRRPSAHPADLVRPRVGPDLEPLARRKQLGVAELIRRHSQREYRVFALGFSPGFAFMGLVEEALAAPRLATPRQRIAAGSVGIAERQTAVYPQASPGGWNLLGRCPVRLFDLTLDGYSLLRAGDRVRFEPIGHAEFVRLGGDDTPLEVQA